MQVEVQVQSLGLDRQKQPVVLLREVVGDRLLPIWIGHAEASSIAMHMADVHASRPLTHDLLIAVVEKLAGRLERVTITQVANNTYYAELGIRLDGDLIRVDARPSDSIALALRVSAPIYAEESLLDQIRLEIEDTDDAASITFDLSDVGDDSPPSASFGGDPSDAGDADTGGPHAPGEGSRSMTPDELERYLRGLDPEDFGRFTP